MVVGALIFAPAANAQVDLRGIIRAAPHTGATLSARGLYGRSELSAIIEVPAGEDPRVWGLPRFGDQWSAIRAPRADLDTLSRAHPTWQMTWTAPLRPLMDRAAVWTGATTFRDQTGRNGEGVIVGIVDTGADVTLADFRNPDGTSRVLYLIDYGSAPIQTGSSASTIAGMAEARCTTKLPCAVYAKADIDARLAENLGGELPTDSVGHGTHVASLAAGNGGAEKKYVGVAPDADIIIARVVDADGNIDDSSLLSATDMVFWLAEQEGAGAGLDRVPAVVNLSLGSDFGPHDGTTSLERALADEVGPMHPGRAIVVAAGNSAALYDGIPSFPNPVGEHTEVNVPELSSVRIPIITASTTTASTLNATIFVYLAFQPGDDLKVGVDRRSGPWIAPVGKTAPVQGGDANPIALIANGSLTPLDEGFGDANAAVVIIDGTWARDETFAIRLEGHGTANLWVQSTGDLGPDTGSLGAVFPAATKESTISLPAASSGLIAVGATLNRTSWTDRKGVLQTIGPFGSVADPTPDSIAFFSAAGPTSDFRIKPDLVAPGAFVVGAMSGAADPATNAASIFAEGSCEPPTDCAVVDSTHAVTAGTSMSSPIVAGAVALLLQGDPTLTEDEILTLLQAGARHPSGAVPLSSQLGAGMLYLPDSLDVEQALAVPVTRAPSAKASWLVLGDTYAHPDPAWNVAAMLQLRDANSRAADGFDESALTISVRNGTVTSALSKAAPGLYEFAVAASAGTGGTALEVDALLGGKMLASATVPIAVDVNVAQAGFAARGGCSVGTRQGRTASVGALALAFMAWRGRRYRRGARKARNRDRTDS